MFWNSIICSVHFFNYISIDVVIELFHQSLFLDWINACTIRISSRLGKLGYYVELSSYNPQKIIIQKNDHKELYHQVRLIEVLC